MLIHNILMFRSNDVTVSCDFTRIKAEQCILGTEPLSGVHAPAINIRIIYVIEPHHVLKLKNWC